MIGPTPSPASDALLDALVEIAKGKRLPSLAEPARLAPLVTELTQAYNDPALQGLGPGKHLAAKLGFYFVRDLPKVAGAAREAIALGRIKLERGGKPLRVLDLGAGLGASHRGLARALDAAGHAGTLDVLALDTDEAALELAREIARRVPREGNVAIDLRADVRPMDRVAGHKARARFDVILLGQVLTELDLERPAEHRVVAHAELIRALVNDLLAPDGTIIVVEPALKPRSRHLQRVRGALLEASGTPKLALVAPCLHREACPLLGRDGDWCHEDLAVDLPTRLQPVAKAAGLRWQGLTFSYLVVGPGGASAASAASSAATLEAQLRSRGAGRIERAVSEPLVSKGKRELVLCGDPLREDADPTYGAHGLKVGRLDREASDTNEPFADAARGDVIALHDPLDEKGRVHRDHRVERVELISRVSE
jgi:SAM-dependent methyltransferase